jgi:hypothetical protein
MMAVATIVERVQWHRGLVAPAGTHRTLVIGVVLLGLGALLLGLPLVPGGL